MKAASKAASKSTSNRIYGEVVPLIEELNIKHTVTKNGRAIRLTLGKYHCFIAVRTGGKYTFTIFSKTKTIENALADFPGSQELSSNSTGNTNRKARVPLTSLETIGDIIKSFLDNSSNA